MARKKKQDTMHVRAAHRTFVCEHGVIMADRSREIDADAGAALIKAGRAVEADPHETRQPRRAPERQAVVQTSHVYPRSVNARGGDAENADTVPSTADGIAAGQPDGNPGVTEGTTVPASAGDSADAATDDAAQASTPDGDAAAENASEDAEAE